MGRRGKKRQLEVEARYWQLLESGIRTLAACRQIGITRKTGYRWRAEPGGLVPVWLSGAVRSSRYLTVIERQRIAAVHGHGVGVQKIARRLGVLTRDVVDRFTAWLVDREDLRVRSVCLTPWPHFVGLRVPR